MRGSRLAGRCVFVLGVLGGLAVQAAAAVTADATSGTTAAVGTQSFSFNHVLGTGANRLVVCSVQIANPAASVSLVTPTLTFGGQTMTAIAASQSPTSSTKIESEMFYINDKTLGSMSGTQTVAVTIPGTAPTGGVAATCSSFFGMAQAGPEAVGTAYNGSGTAQTVTLTTATDGDLVIDAFAGGFTLTSAGKSATVGAGQTQLFNQQLKDGGIIGASSYKIAGNAGSSVGMTWTPVVSRLAESAVAFAPAPTTNYTVSTNVTPVGGGTISLSPSQTSYPTGTSVTVTAVPAQYYAFTGFSGDLSGTTNPQSITVDANKSITATFTPTQCTLTINVVGQGTAGPASGSYNCGSTVNLTATPTGGYSFAGWSGGGYTGSNASASFTLTGNITETVTFLAGTTCTLGTSVTGSGSITLNPSGGTYSCGTPVTITAVPSTGDWSFTGFSGAITGTTNPQTITLNASTTISAAFTQTKFPVNVTVNGPGTVALDPNATSYDLNSQVTITATPSAGAVFTGFSGDVTGSANPAMVTVTGAKNVTANFAYPAITKDAVSHAVSGMPSSSLSWSHTLGAGNNRAVVIAVGSADSVASPDANAVVTSVLFNGVYATPIPNSLIYGGTSGMVQTQLFYLTEAELPAAGTYTVQVNLTGAIGGIQAGAISMFGVSQGPPEAVVAHRDTTGADLISTAITTLTNNAWVIDVVEDNNVTALTANSGQTLAWSQSSTGIGTGGSSYEAVANAGPVTLGWAGSASRLAHSLAAFAPATATVPPTYTLSANVVGGGSISSNPNLTQVPAQTAIQLTATPQVGYSFAGWTGDVTSSSNPLQVVMDANHTITANFTTAPICNLTVNVVGSGSVTPNGGSFNCGTVVHFVATPGSGYSFTSYGGDFSSNDNPADFTITADSTVTVEFDQVPQCMLTMNTVGTGTVTPGSGMFACGTAISLGASAGPGYAFSGFTGDVQSTNNPTVVLLDTSKTVTANFTSGPSCTLTTSVTGLGTVNPSSGTYACGTTITVQALPASHYLFNGFSGDFTGTTSPAQITLNTNKNVVANFVYNTAGVTGDPRTVTEPVYPPVCTKLTALMSTTSPLETSPDTARIQSALNSCPAGQAVEFSSSGTYNAFLIAPITLPAGVTMLLDPDVTVMGSIKYSDYNCVTANSWCTPLINIAQNPDPAPGSGIMGLGVIDGRGNTPLTDKGKTWWASGDTRPRLIYLGNRSTNAPADNFTLYKVTLVNSPKFHVSGVGNNLTVWGIKITTPPDSPNTDGVDPSGSKNITITNSYISDGDDMVAVKAGVGHVSNVTISNNHFYSGHGVSVGSETNAGLNNMYVHDNAFDNNFGGSSYDTLRIKSDVSRGGEVYDVLYKNTCISHGGDTLVFDPYYSSKSGSLIPNFHDISISNLHQLIRDSSHKSTMQGYNTGGTNYPLTITLDNVIFDGATQNDFKAPDQVNNAQITLGPGPVNIASFLTTDAATAANNITIINSISNSNPPLDCSAAFVYLAGDLYSPTATVNTGDSPVVTAVLQNVVAPLVSGATSQPQQKMPTGTVNLMENGSVVGSGSLTGRLAKITVPNISAGQHIYTAQFTGDTNYSTFNFGTLTLTAAIAAPVATSQAVNVPYGTATPITLAATGSGSITYSVITTPTHGTLSGTAPNLTYTPAAGYFGPDGFTFRANNGSDSNAATVSITVLPAPPVANGQSVTVGYNTATPITLTATGSGTLSYTVQSSPAHGTLSGTVPNLTYTPANGYSGADSFTFTANNGSVSNTATVSITVGGAGASKLAFGSAPTATLSAGGNAGTITVQEQNAGGTIVSSASDPVMLTVSGPSGYSQTYTMTASSGIATFNLSSVPLTVAGTYTYTATSGALTQAQATQTVNAAALASFGFSNFLSMVQSGTPASVTVTALDSFGNVVKGFTGTVTFASSDTMATLPAAYAFMAGDAGVHTFQFTLNSAGLQSVSAQSGAVLNTLFSIRALNSVWVLNADGTVALLNSSGSSTATAGSAGSSSSHGSVAVDAAGNVWSVRSGANAVYAFSRTGTVLAGSGFTGGGVNAPLSVSIDGLGRVWVLNGNNSLTLLNADGSAQSPAAGYTGLGLNAPTGMAIDGSGSVWVTNGADGSVTKVIGGAAPVVTPAAAATSGGAQGVRP